MHHTDLLLKALGFVDEEMGRPVIGIANSFNEIIPWSRGLENIVQAVKDGIRNAGGVPIEFNTIGICDGFADEPHRYEILLGYS